jgi:plastocyanin domain-containing protein
MLFSTKTNNLTIILSIISIIVHSFLQMDHQGKLISITSVVVEKNSVLKQIIPLKKEEASLLMILDITILVILRKNNTDINKRGSNSLSPQLLIKLN